MLSVEKFLDSAIDEIRRELKGNGVLACSGGQDSSLLAIISNKAAGNRILSVFIDTGLIRSDEKERVRGLFERYSLNYRIIDASEEFFIALRGVTEPEMKRKIIGAKFIEVFERIAVEFGAETLLQGTIAPDWIESGGSNRDVIKSHHNVGGLPEKMKLKLLEPLRDLYKDEIREVSKYLGLPIDVQPFPGPGLAVRILGEVTRDKADLLRKVTSIVERKVAERFTLEERPWQYFAVLLPVQSTGIHGDRRTYGRTVAIRMIDTNDAMSGTFSKPDWAFLEELSRDITNDVGEINRVVYDVTDKPPATIEWE